MQDLRYLVGLMFAVLVVSFSVSSARLDAGTDPFVQASTPELAGQYIVATTGCNDCHTPGWADSYGTLPENKWLTGSNVGMRGPWGTMYPANVRIIAHKLSYAKWVELFRKSKPSAMVWQNWHRGAGSERDLASVYAFIRSLGPIGHAAPKAIKSSKEPHTPFVWLVPTRPPKS